jgi:hypothetical protein
MNTYLPKLFIRNVGSATSSQIYRVIEDLGFGIVTRINFKGNHAIAHLNWDVENTPATRTLLEEGVRPLLLYHCENRFWKVSAYKGYKEREEEARLEKIRLEEEARLEKIRLEEEAMLEKIRLEEEARVKDAEERIDKILADELLRINQDDDNYSEYIPEDLITSLDYGNATENYQVIRRNIRQRIRLHSV